MFAGDVGEVATVSPIVLRQSIITAIEVKGSGAYRRQLSTV